MLHFHLGDPVPTVKHLHIGLQNPISQIDPLGPLTRSQETPPGSVFNRGLLFIVLGPPNKKKFPTLSPNTDPPNKSHKPLNYQNQKKGDLPRNTKRLIRWVSGISPPGSSPNTSTIFAFAFLPEVRAKARALALPASVLLFAVLA